MNIMTNVIPIASASRSAEQRVARYDWPGAGVRPQRLWLRRSSRSC